MPDTAATQETGLKSVNHILTTPSDLKSVINYINSNRPAPNSTEWKPTPDSYVFRYEDGWVVRQVRPESNVRNKTEVYVRDDGKLLYVLWSELDDNPKNTVQLAAVIAENPTDGKMICLDGKRNMLGETYTTLNYINTLLTYSF